MQLTLEHALNQALTKTEQIKSLYIAYSGGLDSHVLLHLAKQLSLKNGCSLTALHVNYGMSTHADEWQACCALQCKALNIPLKTLQVEMNSAQANIEQKARDVRYDWFKTLMMEDSILLTAHHVNDQAETLVLRMMRASGTRGLASIPKHRKLTKGCIVRPLLENTRAEISAYAQQHKLEWVEDESNDNTKFDRNYIRHDVLPSLKKRWPMVVETLANVAQNCREDQSLLDDLATIDVSNAQVKNCETLFDLLSPLEIEQFIKLGYSRQRNVLQFLLKELCDYPLSQSKLAEWLSQISTHSDHNDTKFSHENVTLSLYGGQLHFLNYTYLSQQQEQHWHPIKPIYINNIECKLQLIPDMRPADNKQNAITLDEDVSLRVHWRIGGERVQLQGEPFSRELKKVFQQRNTAPWLRNFLPLVSINDTLLWSGALGWLSEPLIDQQGNKLTLLMEKI